MIPPAPDAADTPIWLAAWDDADGAARAEAGFLAAFGAQPVGVWAAPGRVNIIGEHTDYNGGLCLPIALPHRTYAALAPSAVGCPISPDSSHPQAETPPHPTGPPPHRADPSLAPSAVGGQTIRLASRQVNQAEPWTCQLDQVNPGTVTGWGAYVAGVAWALRQRGVEVGGFDGYIDSCVPFGAGLSSSAALESAIAVGLDRLTGTNLAADDAGRALLAAACVRAENEIAQAPTGGMDQAASLRCQRGHALLLDCRDGTVRHVPFDLAAEGLALLVIDTRAPHQLVDGQYAERRATCEAAARRLGLPSLREVDDLEAALAALADSPLQVKRVRHVVTEIARTVEFVAMLDAGRVWQTGPLLDASHTSLRDDYEVSAPQLDTAVEAARAAGALGARMTGGGFGGSAIALVKAADVDAVAGAVAAAFARAGYDPPAFLVATPSSAAGKAV